MWATWIRERNGTWRLRRDVLLQEPADGCAGRIWQLANGAVVVAVRSGVDPNNRAIIQPRPRGEEF